MNDSNKETILIKNIQQLKQTIKNRTYNNYELVEPIMIKGVKCSKPQPKAPEWFSNWVKNQYEKDIKHINNRLDKHDQMFDYVLDVFKRNNLK